MRRIENHPVLGPDSSEEVGITVDGREMSAKAGDSIAVALWVEGQKVLRRSKTGQPRGMYCGIGHCFECRLLVTGDDGTKVSVRSCLTPVQQDMRITTESGE
ncbi:(2Fe-2S)-binding protein [Brevibacterium sp. RIT 803]|uniref:(2Fe-2S)-binding protein n=1 Tax=Brevibacterium sp. RIT 803 TaxID=2810210 RepID=UPI00194E07BD|nr:(2Fe-2S)-binding protein [Brevibacterium sp. RIT 803]MBM6590282.1 (2Fe-2S)-binding protein [Brevibacterium sp. RIT 803]